MNEKKIKIGIIGFGNMGSAIAERIKSEYIISVFDKDKTKTKSLVGIDVQDSIASLVKGSEVIILAIKPQDFEVVLSEIRDDTKDKLIISIAAGKTTREIEKMLGSVKVVRAMPNIGAKIGEAESVLCKGRNASDEDLFFSQRLFDCIGKTWTMEEKMLNAATAISGSGLAYIYYDLETKRSDPKKVPPEIEKEYVARLKEAAEKVGFDPQVAFDLAVSTTASALHLSASSASSLSELRVQITSKGGTTEAAIKKLEEGASWADAAVAAKKRAEELSMG